MANKQLTAKVRLNTTQAEQKLRNISKAIDAINRAAGKQSNAYNQVNKALGKTVTIKAKVKQKTDETTKSTKQWSNAVNDVNKKLNSSSRSVGMIGGKLKRLASTYLGVMGMGAIVGTSDMITSAENKLNYVSAQQLGAKGTNADGSYSTATLNATEEAMDKMYASSQKVRMGYGDMMSNVSKSMALAGDAFDNSTDKAIRFQEIMAEAYAVGGASAQEMSSSMYQLIQALGAGVLAGDELRSVREGAPLAYKEIEKFAQKIYECDDSLKDMASDGLITADIVTAAIMESGDAMDKAFAQTEIRFDQVWTQIKTAAIRAFKPISEMLRSALNDAIDSGLLQKVETVFSNVAKGIMITFQVIFNGIHWVADNWDWLQYIVIGVLSALALWYGRLAILAVKSAITTAIAWLSVNASLLTTIFIISLIIVCIVAIAKSSANLCEFLINITLIVAGAIMLALFVVTVMFVTTGTLIMSIPMLIALVVIGVIATLLAAFLMFTGQIVGFVYGIGYSVKAICEWISVAWQNMCSSMGSWFWNAIADMLEGCEWLLNGINKIREALGKDAISVGDIRAKAEASASKGGKELPDIGDAWNTGYSKGFAIGEGIQNKINGFGDKIKNLGGDNPLDKIGNKLGLDFSGLTFPTDGVGDLSFDPSKSLGNIDDNTGKMADSMDLTAEDVEYLRKIAAMEWKKEYTVADIKVDMSNYNTINSDRDLDGIVTKLTEKLYEELNEVADGVYAY